MSSFGTGKSVARPRSLAIRVASRRRPIGIWSSEPAITTYLSDGFAAMSVSSRWPIARTTAFAASTEHGSRSQVSYAAPMPSGSLESSRRTSCARP